MMYCWSHPQQQVAGFLLSMAKNLVQPHFKKKIWTIPLRTSCYLPLSFFSSYLFVLILFCFWCRVAFVDSSLETLLKGFTVAADQRCISPPTRQNCYFHAMLHREFIAVSTDCVHGWVSCYYLCFLPLPPVSFCPRSERWLWRTLWIAGREMQASQNKLHHQLLAGGKKLCTRNLLTVCKLRGWICS